ncbi:unnamed protein product [Heterobilharzia americana]|nr:unnamed protein product [Heterobilharzia americana]
MEWRNCFRSLLFSNPLPRILTGTNNGNHGETVVVDYSSPNIAKPFHLGHFRATVTGNFVQNINEAFGHKVIGINYIGDWGSQFDILTSAFSKYGDEIKFQRNPTEHLYKIYVQAHRDEQLLLSERQIAHGISDGSEVTSLQSMADNQAEEQSRNTDFWQRVRKVTYDELKSNYKRMNIHFTSFEYESDYVKKAHLVVDKLLAMGLAFKSRDGLICISTEKADDVNFSKQNIVLLKSDNSTLYLTRDIAAAITRFNEYQFDRIHYVVEIGQRLHFQQLQYVLTQMGYNWPVLSVKNDNFVDYGSQSARDLLHVPFGRILGMSSRKGEGLFLSNILDNAQQFMLDRMKLSKNTRVIQNESADCASLSQEDIADHLGVTCLVTTMFGNPRLRPIKLNTFLGLPVTTANIPLSTTSSKGGELCGLTLQYCHARLCSLESRMISAGLLPSSVCTDQGVTAYDVGCLIHEYDQLVQWPPETVNEQCFITLANELCRFSSVLQTAYSNYEPHCILQYALELASAVNCSWKRLPVLTCSRKEDQMIRLFIFVASRNVLASCLRLMGVMPLKAI